MSLSEMNTKDFAFNFQWTHNRYHELWIKKHFYDISKRDQIELDFLELAILFYNVEMKRRINNIIRSLQDRSNEMVVDIIVDKLLINHELAEILIYQISKK